ncbi:hypothetical protein ABC337_04955 [Arthrobacter sp. 1P04PC]|uniref:hypothetical protein n=1 Tax=unclassified Arthrobacter TaxID=235627 RepID=UPI00399F16FE
MTLPDNIHQLTRPHWSLIDGDLTEKPPLLAELRAACRSNLGAIGGGTGGAGMIVNSAAVRIETELKAEALNEHFEMTGREYQGGIVELITSWASIQSPEWQDYLEKVTTGWINNIREMLESKRPPWRPSIPCPACSERFHGPEREPCISVHYWDDEAETIAPPAAWTAKCDGCGAEWNGDNLKWLRAAADTPKDHVAEVTEVQVV